MKHRRLLGIGLAGMMVLSVPMGTSVFTSSQNTLSISAMAISQSEVEQKLTSLIHEYEGTTWNDYYYGVECKGFANLMFYKLFDVTYIGAYSEDKSYIPSPSGAKEVGRLNSSEMSVDSAKALLQKGYPGDFIQVRRRNKTYGHSMILVGQNNDRITVFDCNSDGKNTVKVYDISYSDFYSKNSAMSLYHANNYEAVSDVWTEESGWDLSGVFYPLDEVNNTPVYYFEGGEVPNHCIYPRDDCKIDKVYVSQNTGIKYVHVDYPVPSGRCTDYYARFDAFDIKPLEVNHAPVICVDGVECGQGTISISGWAFDEDDRSKSLDIHVYMDNGSQVVGVTKCQYDDEDALKAVVGSASSYKHRFAATFNTKESGQHTLEIAALDNAGGNASWANLAIDIPKDTTNPVISKVGISHMTKEGFRVEIDVTDNVGMKEVKVPVWSHNAPDGNWQDDIIWGQAIKYTDTHWYYDVAVKDHKNDYGKYAVDIYAYDESGNGDEWRGENGKRTTVSIGIFQLKCDTNGGKFKDGGTTFSPKESDAQLTYTTSSYCNLEFLTPTRDGYIFTGWYTEKTGGTKVYGADGKCTNEGTYWKNNAYQNWGDLTVYAQWKPYELTMYHNANGATLEGNDDYYLDSNGDVKLINGNEKLSWVVPRGTWDKEYGLYNASTLHLVRPNYQFLGWSTEKSGGTIYKEDDVSLLPEMICPELEKGNQTVTLYAQWKSLETPKISGDLTDDGEISIADAIFMQRYLHKKQKLTKAQYEKADMNGDGKVNVLDIAILKHELLKK